MADIDGPRHPGGRPTKYDPKYCDELIAFFDVPPTREVPKTITTAKGTVIEETQTIPTTFPTLERFAANIGVNDDTLVEWAKKYPEFSAAYTRAKKCQKDILIANGLMGLYNAQFAIFVAKNVTDMRDKQEVEHSGGIRTGKYSDAELRALAAGSAGSGKGRAGASA